jgi:hypothetical protein
MTTDTKATADRRAEYTAGLRALADLLDARPDLKLPSDGGNQYTPITVVVTNSLSQRADLAAWARAIPGEKTKTADESGEYLSLRGRLRGLHVKVLALRDEVCERVVLATREVTEEVPDPEALAAIPKVAITRTVEDVEWRCTSLLADAAVSR